ncbi:MAG TPA: UDP-2,4-diacetamido-2,4,6-trideoxy-beta-L-altropyranose hydrolase [Chthoniobacter sp.]|nr:UDP-2,4-diacetamido-2,4,6-trideoxy-beta-L-altropyranose hydrolase [Chthoniobacter sp.]
MKPTLLVRADASAQIGVGHVMRCRALAQAWQDDGGEAVFLSHGLPANVAEELRGEGISTEEQPYLPGSENDERATAERARALDACWTVADSYEFGPRFFQQLRESGTQVLAFDDEDQGAAVHASLVLRPWRIAAEPQSAHLDGPAYALLRREFRDLIEAPREIPVQAGRFLITLGGGDPENWTGRLLDALAGSNSPLPPDAELVVVVGAANPHAEALADRLRSLPVRARLERATREMARLLAWADLGLSASGSTCWEICALGLPALILPLNSNQLPIATGLASSGAACNLGLAAEFDPMVFSSAVSSLAADQRARSAMSTAGRQLVDGRGAARVVTQLKSKLIHLRPAGADDARLIWEWANDPAVRAASFRSAPIPWEDHERWFAAQLSASTTHFFIAELEGKPVGQIRFVVEGNEAIISASMSAALRGRRYGSALLVRAAREIFRISNIERIVALIKPGNTASLRSFQRAGFHREDDTVEEGQSAHRCLLRRTESPIHERD